MKPLVAALMVVLGPGGAVAGGSVFVVAGGYQHSELQIRPGVVALTPRDAGRLLSSYEASGGSSARLPGSLALNQLQAAY